MMNFENLLSIAENNKVSLKQLPKLGTELPAPKKEKKDKPRSETVRKLIEEKEREKREKEELERRKRREEEKRNRFVIPRKRNDDSNSASPASSHSNIDSIIAGNLSSRDSSPSLSAKEGDKKHADMKDKSHKSHDKHHSSNREKTSKHGERSSSHSHNSSEQKDKADRTSRDKMNGTHSKSSHHSEKHSQHKDSEHRHGRSENHKAHKSEISDKHKGEGSYSSSKHKSESLSKHKHSSSHSDSRKLSQSVHESSSKLSDKSSKAGKTSAYNLSLDELRAQVKQMKQEFEQVDKPIEVTSPVKSNVNPNLFKPHKDRHGVEASEAEKRKAQILSKTQLILQRTKERLARAKEEERQPKKRSGKTSLGARKDKDETGQIKSKSVCKDDDSDEDEPVNLNFENKFNEEYLTQEPGSILKTIKNKIDEKLSSYNFSDRPAKEKTMKERKEKHEKEKKEKFKEKVKKEKHKLMEELKNKDRREIFGDRNNDSFHSGDDLNKNKIKKQKIIRRSQFQPPPMNFQDLLKLAQEKTKEKVVEPEPIFQPPKKEERPMTQEEKERLERQKESRKRVKQEELDLKRGILPEESANKHGSSRSELNDRVNSWLADTKNAGQKQAEKDGSKLKAALTGKSSVPNSDKFSKAGLISSKPSAFAKQNKTQDNTKSTKYDSEHENVLNCRPSPSKPSRPVNPYMNQSTNPWDRITGPMKKSKPVPELRKRAVEKSCSFLAQLSRMLTEKRKHQAVESSDEDEYDEDDDFIDDDDAGEDYSSHIRQIFGYDKRKYKDVDDDDDNMEVGFSTIMKEEARSARIGLKEDLEDMRREEEELRQKKLAKMKKMKR